MTTALAAIAATWGVAMALAPLLQIRTMHAQRTSRGVSVGYLRVLLVGFVLWLAYGVSIANVALIVFEHGRDGRLRGHDRGRAALPRLRRGVGSAGRRAAT